MNLSKRFYSRCNTATQILAKQHFLSLLTYESEEFFFSSPSSFLQNDRLQQLCSVREK